MKRLAVALLALFMLTGCAKVISEEARRLVDPTISFAKLRENPDGFIGRHVMLGGVIAAVKNTKEGGQLEIVQLKLDDSGMPEDALISGGRFLATSANFLDAMIYKPGRLATIVGEVKGKRTAPLEDMEYTYPVITIREIHVWKSYDSDKPYLYPPPYYYDPYYYGYDVGYPYWYRPLGPVFRR